MLGAVVALLQNTNEEIHSFLNDGAGFQVASPNLTGPIRQAQVKMTALRREGSIEGDDFEVSLQHGGVGLAGALKRRLGEVPDHAENKAADAVPSGQLFEC